MSNIYDLSITSYNTVIGALSICINAGQSLDYDLVDGALSFDTSLVFAVPSIKKILITPPTEKTYQVQENQSIYDTSLQLYGDVSFVNFNQSLDDDFAIISILPYNGNGISTKKQLIGKIIATNTNITIIGNFILAENGNFILTESGLYLTIE